MSVQNIMIIAVLHSMIMYLQYEMLILFFEGQLPATYTQLLTFSRVREGTLHQQEWKYFISQIPLSGFITAWKLLVLKETGILALMLILSSLVLNRSVFDNVFTGAILSELLKKGIDMNYVLSRLQFASLWRVH